MISLLGVGADELELTEHAREEGFKSISSDASSICHKTSSKLFLVINILHLVRCFKICFNYVLPVPMESSVN